MKIIIYILVFFYQASVFAAENDSIFINKGEYAPFPGFLIPEDSARELYRLNFDYKNLEQKNAINEKLLINKENQIDLLSKDNKNLANTLYETEKRNKTILVLTIAVVAVGMVLLTFAVGYAIKTTENIPSANTNNALARF